MADPLWQWRYKQRHRSPFALVSLVWCDFVHDYVTERQALWRKDKETQMAQFMWQLECDAAFRTACAGRTLADALELFWSDMHDS